MYEPCPQRAQAPFVAVKPCAPGNLSRNKMDSTRALNIGIDSQACDSERLEKFVLEDHSLPTASNNTPGSMRVISGNVEPLLFLDEKELELVGKYFTPSS